MQKIKILLLTLLLVYTMTITAFSRDIFAIKSVLGTPQPNADCSISVAAGEVLEFSAADLERRLSLAYGELGGITITTLPTQGALYLEGVEVELYEFLDRAALDELCFVPADASTSSTISFLPQSRDAVTTNLSIQVLAAPNQPPEIEDAMLETVQNISKWGTISASDPEGGAITLQLITKPTKGEVTFSGLSFLYTPYKDMTGADQFTVCAVDNASEYSREAMVNIQIESSVFAFTYADMTTNPSAYAALKLQQAGVLTGEKLGESYFFHPDRQMNRGDYLVLLLNSSGKENSIRPTVNTGLPNDSKLPNWIKPYVAAAIKEGILPAGEAFHYSQIPTRAEAVVLLDRAAAITDVKNYELIMPDYNEIPGWALPSYKDLAAYKMLDLHDGYAKPSGALTNSYAADLTWQLYKHTHR